MKSLQGVKAWSRKKKKKKKRRKRKKKQIQKRQKILLILKIEAVQIENLPELIKFCQYDINSKN